jgi:Family of unknown function (DUF695)
MQRSRIEHFWAWFGARADTIRANPQAHSAEIAEMVERLHPGLSWEMGSLDGKTFDFILRSGDPRLQSVAYDVVRHVPALKQWRCSAWRLPEPRRDFCIKMQDGRSFAVDGFTADLRPDARFPFLHATLSSRDVAESPTKEDRFAARLALESLLGERPVLDAFESIECRKQPPGRIPPEQLPAEVDRQLAELRKRPLPPPTDEWAMVEGRVDGRPILARIHRGPDFGRLLTHPWALNVHFSIQSPTPAGLATPEELDELRPVEERLVAFLEQEKVGTAWRHATGLGRRSVAFYVTEPTDLEERVRSLCREAGRECIVAIEYDPRCRLLRQFLG